MKKLWLTLALAALLLGCAAYAEAETTTVLMYMCGTDLQSDCIADMYEMSSAQYPESVNVVVQAGGASEWDDPDLTAYALNRFVISGGSWYDMQTLEGDSMGDGQTLHDFLAWAVPAYPADRYMLVLWDHGGGSSAGICFDETADYDGLTIHEVYDALYTYNEENPSFHLDVLGCDACLMATYEMAAHMRWFADYLVASEELEPGLGWNYLGWLSALGENPDMDTQSLCVAVADAFMEACYESDPNDCFTQSVVYLPAVTPLVDVMETYSAYLAEALENGQLATISRARQRMYSFGSFADSSTDMVDFMAFLDATREFAPNTAKRVEAAYKKAVRYSVGTDSFDYLTGMSILLPYQTASELGENMNDYSCEENIPNYSQFVEGCVALLNGSDYNFTVQTPEQLDSETASGAVFSGNLQSTVFVPGGSYVADEADTGDEEEPEDNPADALPDVETGLSNLGGVIIGEIVPDSTETETTLEAPVDMDSVYACSMTLSEDELNNLNFVEGLLYMDVSDDEMDIYVELGAMQNAGINWETGDIVSEFDGSWSYLDDQLVAIYDQVVTANARRSIVPVKLNGEDGYLVISFNNAHPEGVITGFTQGFDAQGLPVRGQTKLAEGDEVIPTYPMLYSEEKGSELLSASFDGDPITVGADGSIPFAFYSLEGAELNYLYCFRLTDIYGETQRSDLINFSL